jgi:hypothetical protein
MMLLKLPKECVVGGRLCFLITSTYCCGHIVHLQHIKLLKYALNMLTDAGVTRLAVSLHIFIAAVVVAGRETQTTFSRLVTRDSSVPLGRRYSVDGAFVRPGVPDAGLTSFRNDHANGICGLLCRSGTRLHSTRAVYATLSDH